MAQCTNRKELLRCSNIALNEIQTYPFNEKGLLIMKHKKVSQLLAASLSFLMIAMLCVSSVAMEPSMRIGSVTVHSSLFAKMASESPEKDLITQSNIVKATDEMIQFEEKPFWMFNIWMMVRLLLPIEKMSQPFCLANFQHL